MTCDFSGLLEMTSELSLTLDFSNLLLEMTCEQSVTLDFSNLLLEMTSEHVWETDPAGLTAKQ